MTWVYPPILFENVKVHEIQLSIYNIIIAVNDIQNLIFM